MSAHPQRHTAIDLHGDPALWAQVLDILRQVNECGNGENPVDLGLVSRISADDEEINVQVITASPVCAEASLLIDACFHALAKAMKGQADIYVMPDHQSMWSPGRMDDAARRRWHARKQGGGSGGDAAQAPPSANA